MWRKTGRSEGCRHHLACAWLVCRLSWYTERLVPRAHVSLDFWTCIRVQPPARSCVSLYVFTVVFAHMKLWLCLYAFILWFACVGLFICFFYRVFESWYFCANASLVLNRPGRPTQIMKNDGWFLIMCVNGLEIAKPSIYLLNSRARKKCAIGRRWNRILWREWALKFEEDGGRNRKWWKYCWLRCVCMGVSVRVWVGVCVWGVLCNPIFVPYNIYPLYYSECAILWL